nr:MAG TPA: hypothetical protein [Caudoviricetes sp.]
MQGFAGDSRCPKTRVSPALACDRTERRTAEKGTHLARRRGGGTTARAEWRRCCACTGCSRGHQVGVMSSISGWFDRSA